MAKHHLLGNAGELLALQWLQERGFIILYRNWRHSHYEVDIIAAMENTLHFIEVKTRRNKKYGEPEESVSKKKIMNLMKAAETFQYLYPRWARVQYDVLSISMDNDSPVYFYIEDIYL